MNYEDGELSLYADGYVHLVFWDSLHGEDIEYRINGDGSAQRVYTAWEEGVDDTYGPEENLGLALITLVLEAKGGKK